MLSGGGEVGALAPSAWLTGEALARQLGQVVSREALVGDVWPGIRVVDNALSQALKRARAALGETAEAPVHLLTVPRRGWKLVDGPGAASGKAPEDRSEGAAVEAAWSSHHVTAIVGPGGVGKTTLARALARARGALVVDLSHVREVTLAQSALAEVLRCAPTPAAIDRALTLRGRTWILLDDIDGLGGAHAGALTSLGRDARVHWLLTGRSIPAELAAVRVPLGGLSEDDAVDVLRRALQRPEDDADLRALARAVACWPLALRYAGQRLAAVRARELAARLTGPELLALGDGSGALATCITDAVGGLDATARAALSALGACACPATLDALVPATNAPVELVSCGLATWDGVRYRLPLPVRDWVHAALLIPPCATRRLLVRGRRRVAPARSRRAPTTTPPPRPHTRPRR